ncbi:c-type cytochrome [Pelomicrobium sp.]|jgi:cytochrome c|uniref:c-type cytochrome n=1 Tax=Pelomicrobium sp. TaxID=2815319 RepID=UPI002FDDA291
MKNVLIGIVGAAGFLMVAGPALAQDAKELAQKSGCLACHAEDKKLVGPSMKEIANKYKGQKDAVAKLTEKVKKGGAGVWGQVPMPPHPHLKDEDIKKMVEWYLAHK